MKNLNSNIKDIIINIMLIPFYHFPIMLISIMGFSGMLQYNESILDVIINIFFLIVIQSLVHIFPVFILYKAINDNKNKLKFWLKIILITSLVIYIAILICFLKYI